MKREVVIANDFYAQPEEVVRYAKTLRYYNPYANSWEGSNGEEAMAQAGWWSSMFMSARDCPFKSSAELIERLENLTGERIDRDHWNRNYPEDPQTGAMVEPWPHLLDPGKPRSFDNADMSKISCRWNCAFHLKRTQVRTGNGVHDHVRDLWNGVGMDGWTGLIYLNPAAPRGAGLRAMRNRYGNDRERFTDNDRWELVDEFANVYNRLLLLRGWIPHVGGPGFGTTLDNGRLFQTFFFKTTATTFPSCTIAL